MEQKRFAALQDGKELEKYVYQKKEKLSDKLMVVGTRTGPCVLPLISVRTNAKVNSRYYVENILK